MSTYDKIEEVDENLYNDDFDLTSLDTFQHTLRSSTGETDYDEDHESDRESADSHRTTRIIKKFHLNGNRFARIDVTPPDVLLNEAAENADNFIEKNDVDRAIQEYIRCMALARIVYGDGHWRLANAYANLADAYLDLKGFSEQALLHAQTARNILVDGIDEKESSLHKNEVLSTLVTTYTTLGKALNAQNQFEAAEAALLKGQRVNESRRIYGTSLTHIDIKILQALGDLAMKRKRYDAAVDYFEKVVEETVKLHGDESIQLIQPKINLGCAFQQSGSNDKAIETLLQAHNISDSMVTDGILRAQTAEALGKGYLTLATEEGNKCAMGYFKESKELLLDHYGLSHANTLRVTDEIAKLHIKNKDFEDAIEVIVNSMKSRSSLYGEISCEVAESYKLLGGIRLSQGDMSGACKNFKKAYEMMTAIYGSNNKKSVQIQKTIDFIMQSPQMKSERLANSSKNNRAHFSSVCAKSQPIGGFKTT